MPHADSSNFPLNITKAQAYKSVQESLKSLLTNPTQTNWVANTANASSLLWHMFHALPPPLTSVNWAGFYVLDPNDDGKLILGPFQGKVACQVIRIGKGKGVCGESAALAKTVRVDDVDSWPGHIACDGDSRSEVVVPLVKDDKVVGVLDVDCAELNGFDATDEKELEAIAKILAEGSIW